MLREWIRATPFYHPVRNWLRATRHGRELRRWEADDKGNRFDGGINDIVVAANGGAYATLFGHFVDPPTTVMGKIIYLAPGAKNWTDDKRKAFANDLTRPQLLAVDAKDNESKGDQDPSQWKPPNHDFWCTYATDWVTVKAYWKLTVTTAEKAALLDMLATCS